MMQQVHDLKIENLERLFADIKENQLETIRQVQDLKCIYERGRGSIIAIRMCASIFIVIATWFIQDKVSSYETWNKTQDQNQIEMQKTLYGLENRIIKLEVGKYK